MRARPAHAASSGSVRRSLQRTGTVSASALFLALVAGGGMSLAGAVPGTSTGDGLSGATGSTTNTVNGLVSPVTSALPAPSPQPSPSPSGPLQTVVGTVTSTATTTVKTVTGTVDNVLHPTPSGGGSSGGTQGGSHGSSGPTGGSTGGGSTSTGPRQGTKGTPKVARPAAGIEAAAALPALPRNLDTRVGLSSSTAEQPHVAAASAPELAPTPADHTPAFIALSKRTLPAAIVVIAVAAVAAVGAGHIGVWQNRLHTGRA